MNNLDTPHQDNEQLRVLIDNAREIILKFNMDGEIIFANQGALDITGYIENEILGMNIADILPPKYFEELKEKLFNSQNEGYPGVFLYEANFINRELELIPIEINATAIITNGNPLEILFIARDITKRKKHEKQKIKALKFEIVESFSRGVVRNLNHTLNEIINDIDFVHTNSVPGSTVYRRLDDIKKGYKKVKNFIKQIASISSPGKLMKDIGSIGKRLKKTTAYMMKNSRVKYKIFIQENLWPAAFDDAEMDMVFHNLISNSLEAMSSGGKIQVSAVNFIFKQEENSALFMPSGKYVKISIQDQGEGIPEKYIDKIFDPYFSTRKKDSDIPRGMGLTHVYSIVKRHQAYIDVYSKPGIRTRFTIYLPALSKEKIHYKEAEIFEAEQKMEKNGGLIMGRILFMDDEEIVRDVAGQMLHELGYQVVFARDGAEAVRHYQAAMTSRQIFNAVILDLNVKEGTGGKTAMGELKKINKNVKGIASSGYSNDPEMKDFKAHGFSGVVSKPYNIWELEKVLKQVIEDLTA